MGVSDFYGLDRHPWIALSQDIRISADTYLANG